MHSYVNKSSQIFRPLWMKGKLFIFFKTMLCIWYSSRESYHYLSRFVHDAKCWFLFAAAAAVDVCFLFVSVYMQHIQLNKLSAYTKKSINNGNWTIAFYVVKYNNKCVSKTDTNSPFAFQIAFPRRTDFAGFLHGGSKSIDLQWEIFVRIESGIESGDSRLQFQC